MKLEKRLNTLYGFVYCCKECEAQMGRWEVRWVDYESGDTFCEECAKKILDK